MKHIAIDARIFTGPTGGIGRYTRNLITELAKIDTENRYTVILTPQGVEEFSAPGSNFQPLIVDIPHFSYAEQIKLPRALHRGRFDLVHFTNFNHPILYRRPFVVTIHDMIMHMFPGSFQRGSLLHRKAYEATFSDCRRAEKIIVPSLSTKNDLTEKLGFSAQNIVVTAEGSEAKFTVASSEHIQAVTAKYRLPERYLLFVSRWERYKGLPVLLAAYESLRATHPDLGLVICGRPDAQNPEIAEMVKAAQNKNNRIITPGFVDDSDLPVLYSGASVYVHPSWYEGFGIMILEAFGAGVPVVTSNVSSLPEVVGDAGLLVDPNSTEAVAAAIARILNSPKLEAELRRKGLERVTQYSWAKMARQTLDIYQEILGLK